MLDSESPPYEDVAQRPVALLQAALDSWKDARAKLAETVGRIEELRREQLQLERFVQSEGARITDLTKAVLALVTPGPPSTEEEEEDAPPIDPAGPGEHPIESHVRRRGVPRLRPNGLTRRDELLLYISNSKTPVPPAQVTDATIAEGEERRRHYHDTYATLLKLASAALIHKQKDGLWVITDRGREEASNIEVALKKKRES